MLTSTEVAKILGVEVGTLWNWRSLGLGPAYIKLGPSKRAPVRYLVADVITWEQSLPRISPSVRTNAEAAYGCL